MGYFVRERIFTGMGPNSRSSAVVFAAEDLTDDECKMLAASVQKWMDIAQEEGASGPLQFDLEPSAQEDAATFINLKSEWETTKKELDRYRQSTGQSWQSDIAWLYGLAEERADIIRGLRAGHMPIVYLQCDGGRGFETFDCVDSLTWPEIETLEAVVEKQLYEHAMQFRLVSDWEAEREPAIYVQAKLSWKLVEEDLKNGNADETRLIAFGISCECVEEIKALRKKPIVLGADKDGREIADHNSEPEPSDSRRCEGEGDAGDAEAAGATKRIRQQVEDEDNGGRPVMLDVTGSYSWGPRMERDGALTSDGTFEWTYEDYVYRLESGRFLRFRMKSHCEADFPFDPSVKRLSDAEAAEWLLFSGYDLPDDIAHLADAHHFRDDVAETSGESKAHAAHGNLQRLEPSEELRASYRDPDNYERNVWLYQQRSAGKTNAAILACLKTEGRNFIQLETENALRTAIDSIARHHRWPELKGRPGRPKANASSDEAM